MGFELELTVLLFLTIIGTAIFDKFETETAVWRKITKWSIIYLLTLGLFQIANHWALVIPLLGAGLGFIVHMRWTAKHDIHPIHATPRRRYYELREWQWPED
ncbi:MAG: hypothetical protein GY943_12360 [Chloroflexi bacterium]|nr:hypothetical protein [Chloroflexota bacterium]